jgi:cystathionine beta-lyase/cystathionine gamma-synthase
MTFSRLGGIEAAQKLVESVRVITLAVSLGSVESLIEHVCTLMIVFIHGLFRL